MRRACVLLACALPACSTLQTIISPPQRVDTAVPVSCLPATMPISPRLYPDAELATLDEYKLVLALWHNSDHAQSYIRELEAVLRACK
jgi:hypothetical protein